jgi:hypothetical protein
MLTVFVIGDQRSEICIPPNQADNSCGQRALSASERMENTDAIQPHQTGWIKPTRSRTLPELQQMIADKRAELALLEAEASSLREQAKPEAIAKARNIMRAHQLSLADIDERFIAAFNSVSR